MALLGYLKSVLAPNDTSHARKSTLKGAPTPRTEDEKKARKLASILHDLYGDDDDWQRADVIKALSLRVRGYEWSELEALADELLENSVGWDTLAEKGFVYAPKDRPENEKKARKLADILHDLYGGDDDWQRADVIRELSSRVRGYEWSELEALADELLENSVGWDTLAESDFID